MSGRVALAIAAHPDDIEFVMSGTLLRLKAAGYETHYLNLADGCCGSMTEGRARTRARRKREAQAAARVLGATFHPGCCADAEIFYDKRTLARVAATVRAVRPSIVLTHSLEDYMEDHTNTARLAVTATFVRGMPNFPTRPARRPYEGDTIVYHALPHGLRDAMGRRLAAETFVDVTDVQPARRAALAEHRSQQSWLDATQGMSSYLRTLDELSAAVGKMSKVFRLAEGWRRHNPLGFGAADADPLREALGKHAAANPRYARWLETSRL